LRIINGGASTSFWWLWGEEPLLVSADLDVANKKGTRLYRRCWNVWLYYYCSRRRKIEFMITAQDGSGTASIYWEWKSISRTYYSKTR
jgi:hypothetical protein